MSVARSEATAPLFLSASQEEAAPAAKKSAKKAAKSEKVGKPEKAEKADQAEKADKPAKKSGKKSTAKKTKKAAEVSAADAETTSPAEDGAVESTGDDRQQQAQQDQAQQDQAQQDKAQQDQGEKDQARADESQNAETQNAETQNADSQNADSQNADSQSGETQNEDSQQDESQNDDHGESRSRRRRRGRRGRGRGRGDQGSDNAENSDDAENVQSATDANGSENEQNGDADNGATEAADGDESTSTDAQSADSGAENGDTEQSGVPTSKRRRRRRRRRGGSDGDDNASHDDPPNTVVHEREPRTKRVRDEVQGISGSTRLEAKRQRRRDGRDAGRRRPPILTESEFLARRESVERVMVVRERAANSAITSAEPHAAPTEDYTQIAVLEDGVLVEHFVTTETSQSMVGNIYLGRVQNVLPGMEAAFVDIGRGRNGVLYAGEVNWEAAGLDGGSRKIEQALKPGDHVLVQVSKDPIGHKGARLTTQISLAGRYLVYVPGGTSTGISRKLPDTERKRLKQILSKLVPDEAGVIIRTASEGVSAEDLGADIERLEAQWKSIEAASEEHKARAAGTPKALYEEPDLLVRVVRDLFNEDFRKLVIEGNRAWSQVSGYVGDVAPDLAERLEQFTKEHADAPDSFAVHRIDEQLAKALDRKVWLPSGGTLIIEHTEAMTVVDVNTGKFTGSGGNLEETVTRNNLEAAEEIVRQMRLRDIGGMIIVDFIDMVLESNRDLVLRRLTEALARDRTRHQVSEVTSLGLVQMTRKRLGTGLLEAFSTTCTACSGRGVIVHANPIEVRTTDDAKSGGGDSGSRRSRRSRRRGGDQQSQQQSSGSQHDSNTQSGAQQTESQPKAPHKPAAEHPMFRAMAHGEQPEAENDRPAAQKTAAQKTAAQKPVAAEPVAAEADKPVAAEKAPVEDKPAAAEPAVVEPAVVEPKPEQTPAVATRRRRRAVRRTAGPTGAAEAEAASTSESVVEQAPVTTVAPQAAEPIVAVKRSSRRRTGRRVAGPPPAGE